MTVVKIKKQKARRKGVINRLKFENQKTCLEASQLENKINHLEKNRIDIEGLKKDHR